MRMAMGVAAKEMAHLAEPMEMEEIRLMMEEMEIVVAAVVAPLREEKAPIILESIQEEGKVGTQEVLAARCLVNL